MIKSSSISTVFVDWNELNVSAACSWQSVVCGGGGVEHVRQLFVTSTISSNLDHDFKLLTGSLPTEIGNLDQLKNLYV